MTRVFLLRHAESEWNAAGLWQGQADPPLSEHGRREAAEAAPCLAGEVSRVVSSDLRRAAETAGIIADVLGLAAPEYDPALREIDVGAWSGLTSAQIEEGWPGGIELWRDGKDAGNAGEDRSSFRDRILAAVIGHASHAPAPLLIVTHGAAIGVVERHLGVHPGVPVPRLSGRWLTYDGELRPAGDRVPLVSLEGKA